MPRLFLSLTFMGLIVFSSSARCGNDTLKVDRELLITATYSAKVLCENPPGYDTDSVMIFRLVRNSYFTGVIFPKEKGVGLGVSPTRYTLSSYEVSQAEQIIKNNIKKLNQLLKKRDHFRLSEDQIPNLSYNDLKDFFRQYVGYKQKDGDIIVQITFERNHTGDFLLEEIPHPTDAYESYNYFGFDVNITKKRIIPPQGYVY